MDDLVPVDRLHIHLGEPLPYSLYDRTGLLLVKAGYVINIERQLNRLLEGDAFAHRVEKEAAAARVQGGGGGGGSLGRSRTQVRQHDAASVFEMLEVVKVRLQRLFDNYRLQRGQEEFIQRIEGLALTVQECCTHDTDAALACLHLDYESNYAVVHHLQAALLCELVGRKLEVPDDSRLSVIQAALTHDMGLIDIQDILDKQVTPLTSEQKTRIQSHPEDTVRLLSELGVADPVWLDTVHYHHERNDGSGYPEGISNENIRVQAKMLAVADIYSAMIRERPYRKAMLTRDVMRGMLMDQGDKIDQRLTQAMIKEIGVFPPGAIVRLINGEIGVVKERRANGANPVVYSFIRSDGSRALSPIRRDTLDPVWAVEGLVPFSYYKECIILIRGLWTQG